MTLISHPLRGAVLGEVHARPFIPISGPKHLLHCGFMTGPEEAIADRARLAAFCAGRAQPEPRPDAKYHHVILGDTALRWEQHSEFTTYTWELTPSGNALFQAKPDPHRDLMQQIGQPGPLLVAVDLHLVHDREGIRLDDIFDVSATAAAIVDGEGAFVAADFRATRDGLVRLLVVDRGLTEMRAGALVQRLLEIETYRTLALLGLPEAQKLSPFVRTIEDSLTRIARRMTDRRDLDADSGLLVELTELAARIEAEANVSGYRLAASRAYDGIVQQRLVAIEEQPVPGYPTIAAFLARRMAPAMRTCSILESRLDALSQRLARSTQLLRTRVEVEIEQQNRGLLEAMNERVRLQLLLQQTVESLSVAAISYYVVSLAAYVFKGLNQAGFPVDPGLMTAASVPFVVVVIAVLVRRIRRRHTDTVAADGSQGGHRRG
jgi:uncharacterized membrane-anchored protein